MVLALEAVPDLAQPDDPGHVLQLAVAIGRAGEAVEGVVGDVELHDAAADLRDVRGLGVHDHAVLARGGARGGGALSPVDIDDAEPAGAEGIEAVGGAQLRDGNPGLGRGSHHGGTGWDCHLDAVDVEADGGVAHARGRAEVEITQDGHRCSIRHWCSG